MQIVKPLVFLLLTYSLLSCANKTETVTTGSGDTGPCGETLVGVTTEAREYQVAGATLYAFKLGNYNTNITPEFQRIASEAAMNEDSRVKIACKAMRMSGGEASPEMLTYYMHLLGFLGSNPPPTVEQRMAWAEKFPVPKPVQPRSPNPANTGTAGSVQAPQESLSDRLVRICKQPVDGLNRQPEGFLNIWIGSLSELRREKFPAQRDLQSLYNIKGMLRDRGYNNPDDVFRESLYALKCLVDAGEIIRLESTGTTGKYGEKVFENLRIVFK